MGAAPPMRRGWERDTEGNAALPGDVLINGAVVIEAKGFHVACVWYQAPVRPYIVWRLTNGAPTQGESFSDVYDAIAYLRGL